MDTPFVSYITTLPLKYAGDCNLLGVTGTAPDFEIYAEEVYGDDWSVAQHALSFDGTILHSIDEADGAQEPLPLPLEIIKPKTGWHTMTLNFAGPRHRGMREPERAFDLVRPMAIPEKLIAVSKFRLDMLMGIAESYVLAETEVVHPNLYFVCRRLRLAVALSETQLDEEHQPYDYDTKVIYAAHFYARNEPEPSFTDILGDLTDVPLHRPMDCLRIKDYLFIADGGEGERMSAIHVWRIDLPEPPTDDEKLRKKIYG